MDNLESVEVDPAVRGGPVRWTCGTCRRPIHRGGMLGVDLSRANEVRQHQIVTDARRLAGDGLVSLQDGLLEVLTAPPLARWEVACDDCPDSGRWGYAIELEVCRSLAALIRWTAHLYGKSWFRATDWIGFMARVARENSDPLEPTGVH